MAEFKKIQEELTNLVYRHVYRKIGEGVKQTDEETPLKKVIIPQKDKVVKPQKGKE
ncbi:MAG: hypothetical protein NY202_02565 [Mollicutes bacterium UO1]